ncbi:unnamed protein product, partial [Closterium sp. NIES-53]
MKHKDWLHIHDFVSMMKHHTDWHHGHHSSGSIDRLAVSADKVATAAAAEAAAETVNSRFVPGVTATATAAAVAENGHAVAETVEETVARTGAWPFTHPADSSPPSHCHSPSKLTLPPASKSPRPSLSPPLTPSSPSPHLPPSSPSPLTPSHSSTASLSPSARLSNLQSASATAASSDSLLRVHESLSGTLSPSARLSNLKSASATAASSDSLLRIHDSLLDTLSPSAHLSSLKSASATAASSESLLRILSSDTLSPSGRRSSLKSSSTTAASPGPGKRVSWNIDPHSPSASKSPGGRGYCPMRRRASWHADIRSAGLRSAVDTTSPLRTSTFRAAVGTTSLLQTSTFRASAAALAAAPPPAAAAALAAAPPPAAVAAGAIRRPPGSIFYKIAGEAAEAGQGTTAPAGAAADAIGASASAAGVSAAGAAAAGASAAGASAAGASAVGAAVAAAVLSRTSHASPPTPRMAPPPAPRWGQPKACTWDESAVGADDDVAADKQNSGDGDGDGEAGVEEDVFPDRGASAEDDDGVESWWRDAPREKMPIPTFNRPAVVAAVGVVAVRVELFRGEVLAVARGSKSSVGVRPFRPSSFAELLRSGVAIFDLDYDAILAAMYALSISAEGGCYLCVPPDPGIEATALGASESALPGTAPAKALHTFTLDSGASRCFFRDSTTLTPLSAPVPVRLADPSGDPVLTRSSTVLPCPTVPSGSLSGLHLPSFSTNLVSTTALQDAMVITTTLGGQRVSICTCTRTGHHLATFTCRPGSNLYTLGTEPPQ